MWENGEKCKNQKEDNNQKSRLQMLNKATKFRQQLKLSAGRIFCEACGCSRCMMLFVIKSECPGCKCFVRHQTTSPIRVDIRVANTMREGERERTIHYCCLSTYSNAADGGLPQA